MSRIHRWRVNAVGLLFMKRILEQRRSVAEMFCRGQYKPSAILQYYDNLKCENIRQLTCIGYICMVVHEENSRTKEIRGRNVLSRAIQAIRNPTILGQS